MPEQTSADMDGGWKQMLDDYLEAFFQFFFPQVHAAMDFHLECQSLDKELAKIMVGAEVGDREVDKLLQVHWRDGGDDWVLVHVDVQAQHEVDFAQRMCVYNCRIWERYERPVVSLALLVDGDPRFRPDRFTREGRLPVGIQLPGGEVARLQERPGVGGRSEPVCRGLVGSTEQAAGGKRRRSSVRIQVGAGAQLYRRGYGARMY